MPQITENQSPLSPYRAFVVQFHSAWRRRSSQAVIFHFSTTSKGTPP